MTKLIKSPLRYPGGKFRARKEILSYFPDGITKVVSPFMGGGNIEINLANQGIKVLGCDLFHPVCAFWERLNRNDCEDFANQVYGFFPITTPKRFKDLQEELIDLLSHENGLDYYDERHLTALFYAINRASMSGTGLNGGSSKDSREKRFTVSSIDRIRNWKQLRNLIIFECDFRCSITGSKNDFIFADPPYLLGNSKNNLYGNKGDLHKDFDHKTLFELLNKRDGWILCYNDCPTIREMYSRFKIVEPEWSYGMGNNKKSRELLILNY